MPTISCIFCKQRTANIEDPMRFTRHECMYLVIITVMRIGYLAFALSLILHLLLTIGIRLVPYELVHQQPKTDENIEVEYLNDSESLKTIVRQNDVPLDQLLKELQSKANYLSEKSQRVIKETKVEKTGLSQNIFSQKQMIKQQSQLTEKNIQDKRTTSEFEQALQQRNQTNSIQTQESQIGEVVRKEVAVGQITALNTDQYTYYSFFSRVQELIRFRWENIVENAMIMSHPLELAQLPRKNIWITEVEFLLDAQGQLTRALVLRESGFKKFDLAAVNSFKEARVFPNPPKELIENDGFIHLKYRFHVNYSPAYSLNK